MKALSQDGQSVHLIQSSRRRKDIYNVGTVPSVPILENVIFGHVLSQGCVV